MRIHFIAIGGAVMHNLAIVLKRRGDEVSGSDDQIDEPAASNLKREGLLPADIGFFAERITADLDAVLLGMHARADNPELLRAQELGLKIYSFPEYIYEVSKKKQRVVIAGSHGKTTITSMVMHVLREAGMDFDYLVGAKVPGFDTGVRLTEKAPIIVLEGDEYLASPINRESKFMFYHPNVALISGIAWDHINVFPNYEDYVQQFEKFAYTVEEWGFLTWYAHDEELQRIFHRFHAKVRTRAYDTPAFIKRGNITFLQTEYGEIPLKIFGEHNLQNIAGAKDVCNELGVFDEDFYRAIATFTGAANRLQKIGENEHTVLYKDFAHSPSKLRATIHAVKQQFPHKELIAVMELHTFSSLNHDFLKEYEGAMDEADVPVVYYDADTFTHKKMEVLSEDFIRKSFALSQLAIFTNPEDLQQFLIHSGKRDKCFLLMSSGNFSGMDINALGQQLLNT